MFFITGELSILVNVDNLRFHEASVRDMCKHVYDRQTSKGKGKAC